MVVLLAFILVTLEAVTKKVYFGSNVLKNSARCTYVKKIVVNIIWH